MSKKTLSKNTDYYSIQQSQFDSLTKAPATIKILFENLLRHHEKRPEIVKTQHLERLLNWKKSALAGDEIPFFPARVLLQDFSGIPLLVDMAAMRDMVNELGGDCRKINPLKPMELVIDHSIVVDHYGDKEAYELNQQKDYERNAERYRFFKWAQQSFQNFTAVPPHTGIVHQVNIEYLARGVFVEKNAENEQIIYPDTAVGTDSHTTMMNGLGLLGWGVGGIEAEAVSLDLPIPLTIPYVLGVKLNGKLPHQACASDLVLTLTHILRKKGVVGRFVEFFGPGVSDLSVTDRVTISNMSPEFGSTAALFPIDEKTIAYFQMTGRDHKQCALIEQYYKAQGLWFDPKSEYDFHDVLEIDLSAIKPTMAGPGRPQDRIEIETAHITLSSLFPKRSDVIKNQQSAPLQNGHIVIAAITSCTNTSNPFVLIQAGLLAKKAVEKGLQVPEWVKTSLAPGSQTVSVYLKNAGLLEFLEKLGFYNVGYGCTTCIGNSGPLKSEIEQYIEQNNLNVAAILSGNRNFEGRIHPFVRSSFLASPTYVVAYALAGHINIDWNKDPLATVDGNDIYLKDIWPTEEEILSLLQKEIHSGLYAKTYAHIFEGDQRWKDIKVDNSLQYHWNSTSSYLKRPPYTEKIEKKASPPKNLKNAHVLCLFGDSVTTDHISPAGSISSQSPAGTYLLSKGIQAKDFNSYGARRGHDEIMIRGTFANKRLKNKLVTPTEGGVTIYWPSNTLMSIYDAAILYKKNQKDLIILAGKEYGSGSSRDWAAKGTSLLGVRCILAQSYERIHRSNLIGMGVIPLSFLEGESAESLNLDGSEIFDIEWTLGVRAEQKVKIIRRDRSEQTIQTIVRIDSEEELRYLNENGIIPYVIRQIIQKDSI